MELHEILKGITAQVYHQPPNGTKMVYPCIVYVRDSVDTSYADNRSYRHTKKYTVTVIDRNVDSPLPDAVGLLPMCQHDRFFIADGLNHDVFTLYY